MPGTRRMLQPPDREAVHAVIATILLVALALVVSTVAFVLVDRVRPDGEALTDAPLTSLHPTSYRAGTEWVISVTHVSHSVGLHHLEFYLTTPDRVTVAMRPPGNDAFAAGEQQFFAAWSAGDGLGPVREAAETPPGATTPNLRVRIVDVSGDERLNPFDQFTIAYDDADADAEYGDALPGGEWVLEVYHPGTDLMVGSVSRNL